MIMRNQTLQSRKAAGDSHADDITPGQRIMLAVLNDALSAFERGLRPRNANERQQFREVDRWIANTSTDWPFAFENVCGRLGINPDYLRDGLKRLKRKVLRGAAPSRAKVLAGRVPPHVRSNRA